MASSTSKRKSSYDVFLSFRGTDVRNNFLGHLYTALDQAGLFTYMDNEELRKGEEITLELMKAIDDSRIAIIIFSKDYASSSWCLDELTRIMLNKKHKDLIVLPVFYKVEPREVRTPRGIYKEAMAKHGIKFGNDSEKVKRWNEALLEAGSLSGWELADGYEPKFIQDIIHEISTQLDRTPLPIVKYPIGIDSRVHELKTILNLQSRDDVLMIGLWGQGGVGKTTLAKAIYNVIFREFQGSCFLENVREHSQNSNDLIRLQEKLLSKVLQKKRFAVRSFGQGIQSVQNRLSNKKVLIILDDVDDRRQLDALVGNCEWFGKGSRIIIATRDMHLLTAHGVHQDHIYEVKVLNKGEALELFKQHAFRRNQKIEIRGELVDRVVHYARGLPLALEVLGSFLCRKGEKEWKSNLQKLAKSPNKEINNVLKVSYDGLEDHEKEIFLDIACFFKGLPKKYITKVLDSCDFETGIGVPVLLERSLISEERRTLQMHDLIQSMAMNIVKEECRDDPGKRSRLWFCDDIVHVLSGDMGTDAIKAIVLKQRERKEIDIRPDAFTKMKNLRLLIMINVDNSFPGPIHLPNELRWFEWPQSTSFPKFSGGPKKLVGLAMQNSKIEVGMEQLKDYKKLKFINFSECQCLVHMPNLSFITDLEELNLNGCKNLESVQDLVAYPGKLRSLKLRGCSRLRSFPDVLRSEDLHSLALANSSEVQRFSIIPNQTIGLQELDLEGTSIRELPASIENIVYLEKLKLTSCKELSILPSSIYRLQNLRSLVLEDCSKLIKFPKVEIEIDPHFKKGFPKLGYLNLRYCNLSEVEFLENPSCFPSLKVLDLENNNFTNLPACGHLNNLHKLDVRQCSQLQEIRELPRQLQCLCANDCKSLSKIPFDGDDIDSIGLSSCHKLASNVPAIYDLFKIERVCSRDRLTQVSYPGGEMPEWLIPNDDGYISFMASEDLFNKFLGLAVCLVARVKEEEQEAVIEIIRYMPTPIGSPAQNFHWHSDHVDLACYGPRDRLWHGEFSGPNDWRCFKFAVRAISGGFVKKCGFRLICKPLENDWEVFLQHNQSLNPDLLYEVEHEESQMSAWEEIPSELEDSEEEDRSSEDNLSADNSSMVGNISTEEYRYSLIHPNYRNVHPGGEMPEKFVLIEDGTISFMASQNLYDKILGLALCAVFGVEDSEREVSFSIVPYINGQRRNALSGTLGPFDSDHMWIQYLKSNVLWGLLEGGVDFSQFDDKYLQFSLRIEVSGGTMKKLGYVIRCSQLEDNLKVLIEENQLVNLASLCEDAYEPEDDSYEYNCIPYERSFSREYLRRCHLHIEEPEASDSDK